MMECIKVNRKQIIEKYVLNELSKKEKIAFEKHYFECQSCADDVFNTLTLIKSVKIGAESELLHKKNLLKEDLEILIVQNEEYKFSIMKNWLKNILKANITNLKKYSSRIYKIFNALFVKHPPQYKIQKVYYEDEIYILKSNYSQFDDIVYILIQALEIECPVIFTFIR